MKMITKCPMTIEAVEKYSLTETQVKKFCGQGCSIICQKLFDDYVTKKAQENQIESEVKKA